MKVGGAVTLLKHLNPNWAGQRPSLAVEIADGEVTNVVGHTLESELEALCSGAEASFPFFLPEGTIRWCTVAPTAELLRGAISDLQSWVLPSFGWEGPGDGFILPHNAQGALATEILRLSPHGYFRWQSRTNQFRTIAMKLGHRRQLESARPPRSRPVRPSLYELRSAFSTALLLGDRSAASRAIDDIDLYQLDSAANTQFMRIRMWHHFHEFDRIVNHPDLARLRTQLLPASVSEWIREALEAGQPAPTPPAEVVPKPLPTPPSELARENWDDWFSRVTAGDDESIQDFLRERQRKSPDTVSPTELQHLVARLEELYLDEELLRRRRELLSQGLVEFLQDFVREPNFPRVDFGDLYVAVLRVWGALHAGTGARGQESHVLLELASAALQLNRAPAEVLAVIVQWWAARKVPAQLPFLLDAIELLAREHPDQQAPANLWIEAAELVRREPERLTPSDKNLWRRVGLRIGMDESTIAEYLPQDEAVVTQDILKTVGLEKVAIVCMRERQAADAAAAIAERSGAKVSVVSSKQAGEDTSRALKCDVVLFVWMATTHAVFRAFDGLDRRKFCYVQGTGAASIVVALERWAAEQSGTG